MLQKKNSRNCSETKLKILRKREFDSFFFIWQRKSLMVQHGSAMSKRKLRVFFQNENFCKSNYDLFRPTLGVTALFSNDTMKFYYIENVFFNSFLKNIKLQTSFSTINPEQILMRPVPLNFWGFKVLMKPLKWECQKIWIMSVFETKSTTVRRRVYDGVRLRCNAYYITTI